MANSINSFRNRTFTVYSIRCNRNGKNYVGVTCDLQNRLYAHMHRMRIGKHSNREMQDDYNRYGADFSFYELETGLSANERLRAESRWIEKLDSVNNGYNRPESKRMEIHVTKGIPPEAKGV